jgi:hypothetical protein
MNVRMDTDVKINIGLAGSHINKELHKLVEEMQKQIRDDEK